MWHLRATVALILVINTMPKSGTAAKEDNQSQENNGNDRIGYADDGNNGKGPQQVAQDFSNNGNDRVGFSDDGNNGKGPQQVAQDFSNNGNDRVGFSDDGNNGKGPQQVAQDFSNNGNDRVGFSDDGNNGKGPQQVAQDFSNNGNNRLGFFDDGNNGRGAQQVAQDFSNNGNNRLGFSDDGNNGRGAQQDFSNNGNDRIGYSDDGNNGKGPQKDSSNNGNDRIGFSDNGNNGNARQPQPGNLYNNGTDRFGFSDGSDADRRNPTLQKDYGSQEQNRPKSSRGRDSRGPVGQPASSQDYERGRRGQGHSQSPQGRPPVAPVPQDHARAVKDGISTHNRVHPAEASMRGGHMQPAVQAVQPPYPSPGPSPQVYVNTGPGYSAYPAPAMVGGYPPAAAAPYGYNQPTINYQQQTLQVPTLPAGPIVNDKLPMDNVTTVPQMNSMDAFQGYANISFKSVSLPPPPYESSVRGGQAASYRGTGQQFSDLDEQQARSALLEFCSGNCCYGSGAAKEMTIVKMTPSTSYHYVLETFSETRAAYWDYTGFSGGSFDGPSNGPVPLPWAIPLSPAMKFKNETRNLEVPHTASVKQCHRCIGFGKQRCHQCSGRGRSGCTCQNGYTLMNGQRQVCPFCHGAGYRLCAGCNGDGQIRCSSCSGHGKLKWFIRMTVTWTNNTEDFILEKTSLPQQCVRTATGQIAFEDEQPCVFPVSDCPESSVNRASAELINRHQTRFANGRILMQRQRIRVVPVTEVVAQWKEKMFSYFVFGLQHSVYTTNYPQSCCCCCSLL